MPPYDQRPDRKGRFKFDDTIKKWVVRIAVTWLALTLLGVGLLVAGVWAVAT